MSEETEGLDVSALDVDTAAAMLGEATDEQLAEMMASEMRGQVLAEVFRRMEEHFRPESAADVDAVIHFKIADADRHDHWEVVVSEGRCVARPEPSADPRVTLHTDGVNFMRLVTGNAAGPALFMAGKLRIEGDIMFSARIASLFTIPSGAQS